MKLKLPLLLSTALLALSFTACTIQVGLAGDPDSTSGKTDVTTTPGYTSPTETKDPLPPVIEGTTTVTDPDNKPVTPAVTTTAKPETTPKPTTTTKPITTTKPLTTTKPVTTTKPYEGETAVVEAPANAVNAGQTFTGKPPLADITYTVNDPLNKRGLPLDTFNHSFGAAKNGQPHSITVNNQKRLDSYGYNALTWDNKTEEKVLYLTFDAGYKYGDLVIRMLDVLKEKDVPAAFFGTMAYFKAAPEEVVRMINEGHIVGNHTANHPTNCDSISRKDLAKDILLAHNYLRKNFGYDCEYFRFPAGRYSENTLELVSSLGYRSAFWSLAHTDWDPDDQPGVDKSFKTVTERLHPGAVILLHTTSPDNADILADFIDYAREQGYEFRSLDEYAYWDQ